MAGLCEGGNEPPGSLKAINRSLVHIDKFLQLHRGGRLYSTSRPGCAVGNRTKIKTSFRTCLRNRLTAAVNSVTQDILQRVWDEFSYRLDVVRAAGGNWNIFKLPSVRSVPAELSARHVAVNQAATRQKLLDTCWAFVGKESYCVTTGIIESVELSPVFFGTRVGKFMKRSTAFLKMTLTEERINSNKQATTKGYYHRSNYTHGERSKLSSSD
ncbi:hypothetical protein ANN_05801 [Periplaneta americana]|uniref:Uncharacterized protein n=1 Tax=Periplaneta americana TaxID=6978 RepID=A0ABQ8TBT4_PERAM|nr:hypothetical protein ANN_05801 [Periplaneta americana]